MALAPVKVVLKSTTTKTLNDRYRLHIIYNYNWGSGWGLDPKFWISQTLNFECQ